MKPAQERVTQRWMASVRSLKARSVPAARFPTSSHSAPMEASRTHDTKRLTNDHRAYSAASGSSRRREGYFDNSEIFHYLRMTTLN